MHYLMLGTAFLSVCACDYTTKSAGIGGDDQLIVFADSSEWVLLEQSLRQVFEREFTTPQAEKEFFIQHVPISTFDSYRKYKNIIMAGTLGGPDIVSQTIEEMLSPEARQTVEDGEHFVVTRADEWAHGQMLMILVAPSSGDLVQSLKSNQEYLYNVFDKQKSKLVYNFIYRTSAPLEDKKLQQQLYDRYKWTMKIHPDYKLVDEKPDLQYVRFHSYSAVNARQSWISVHWQSLQAEGLDTAMTPERLKVKRRQLGRWFKEQVTNVAGFDTVSTALFNEAKALCYRGIWKTIDPTNPFGGVFRTYMFYDDKSARLFVIDQAVFYPSEARKLKVLRELDVISKTFKTEAPGK